MSFTSMQLGPERRTGLALGALAAALVLLATSVYTIGLYPDSATYFSVARSLAEGEGFRGIFNRPIVSRPPLYSIMLAPGAWLGIPLEIQARLFNTVAHAGSTLAVFLYLWKRLTRPALVYLATAVTAVSYPLLWISRFALPDGVYTALSTWAVCYLAACLDARAPDEAPIAANPPNGGRSGAARLEFLNPSLQHFIATAIFASLAPLARYNGVVLIALLFAVLVWGWRRGALRPLSGAMLLAAASIPLGLWLVRNRIVSGGSAAHEPIDRSVIDVLGVLFRTISEWMHPMPVLWLLVAIAVLIAAFRKGATTRSEHGALLLAGAYILLHAGLIVLLASTRAIEFPGVRYMAPIFPPLVLIAAILLDRLDSSRLIFATSLLFLGGQTHLSGRMLVECLRNGAGGFSTRNWANSAVVRMMKELGESGAVVYCNHGTAAYLLAGLPMRDPSDALPPERWFAEIVPTLPPDLPVYMVWFPLRGYSGQIKQTEPFVVPGEIVLDIREGGIRGRIYRLDANRGAQAGRGPEGYSVPQHEESDGPAAGPPS